jgi:hypothetical protein
MTNTPATYRLTLNTEDGFVKRYLSVEEHDGNYLLRDAHMTIVAPHEGLVQPDGRHHATGRMGTDSVTPFNSLASANAAAQTLYDKYRNNGWQDATTD